jgi:hypothetical protein
MENEVKEAERGKNKAHLFLSGKQGSPFANSTKLDERLGQSEQKLMKE